MSKQIRYGILGCGIFARHVGEGIQNAVPSACTVSCFDISDKARDEYAERFGCRPAANEEELIVSPEIDCIYIATPHCFHFSQAIAALKAGKHVCVEKPMAISLAEARKLVKTAERSGKILTVPLMTRYRAHVRQAREIVKNGTIGTVTAIQISGLNHRDSEYFSRSGGWIKQRDMAGGGPLIMGAIHGVDTACFVTGLKVRGISAECDRFVQDVEVEDFAQCVLRFSNGALGHIQWASGAVGKLPGQVPLRVWGTEGQLALSNHWTHELKVHLYKLKTRKWKEIPCQQGEYTYIEAFFRDLTNAILENGRPEISSEDAYHALEVILGAYRSNETGRRVEIGL